MSFYKSYIFFVLNPSGLCLLYRSSQVWTNPTWSSSALSWPRKGQARPFGSLCPSLINRDGKDIDHDFDSQDSWWPFRARSSRLASVAIVHQTSHSATYIVTHDHIWRSRLSIDFVTTFKCDSSVTSCLCTHRNFAGTMGTDWADVATLFSGIWYQPCYHFPRVAMFRTTILERYPVFPYGRMQPTSISWWLWMCCQRTEETETDRRCLNAGVWGSPNECPWNLLSCFSASVGVSLYIYIRLFVIVTQWWKLAGLLRENQARWGSSSIYYCVHNVE